MSGKPSVVDIGEKTPVPRRASASGLLKVPSAVIDIAHSGEVSKGNVKNSAGIAAIMAVKNTPSTLPHCHPIPIEGCDVKWENTPSGLKCLVTVKTTAKTGVEMEALNGVTAALLCAWDMLKPHLKNQKGLYPGVSITEVIVVTKDKGSA
tara:strand:+ start:17223 stop:17672 length:450 start_codon:yes stop_codon:yes gene_type:complete